MWCQEKVKCTYICENLIQKKHIPYLVLSSAIPKNLVVLNLSNSTKQSLSLRYVLLWSMENFLGRRQTYLGVFPSCDSCNYFVSTWLSYNLLLLRLAKNSWGAEIKIIVRWHGTARICTVSCGRIWACSYLRRDEPAGLSCIVLSGISVKRGIIFHMNASSHLIARVEVFANFDLFISIERRI
jgi:hypothetical protein